MSDNYNTRELLMMQALDRQNTSIAESIKDKDNDFRHKSEKNATLDDFIQMVSMIVAKTLSDKEVEFKPDEGFRIIYDSTAVLNNPIITYKIIERIPGKELKTRPRETNVLENANDNESRLGTVYGQRQNCLVQFNVIASEYTSANEVMNSLEDILFSYSGYFKKNGVLEIIFRKHYTDETYDVYRQKFSVRNIIYSVSIEKLFVIFDGVIDSVTMS